MSKFFRSLLFTVTACVAFGTANAQFTTGNVVVLQVGDGTAALSNIATPISIKEYNTITAGQSAPVNSVNVPATGAARLTIGGTATSEGFLTLSADSLRIVIAGYDTGSTGTGVTPNGIASALLARVGDTLSRAAVPGRAVSTNTAYNTNNIRSVVRGNAENYWGAGNGTANNGGTYYFGLLSAPAYVQTTVNNTRVNAIFNGNIYFSTGSAPIGIYKIAGMPTTATAPVQLFATGTSSSPYAFSVNSTETIVYVADDRVTGNAGGIQKWVYSGGSWGTLPADTLTVGTNIGARGLAVDWSGTYPAIYVTTTDNRLVKVIDSNLAQNTYVTLATAPTNTAFRSVTFTPRALCVNPVLSATITPYTCAGNGAVSVSVTSGTTPATYSWTGPGSYTANTQNISNLQAGTYVLTATTAVGGCSTTQSFTVANNTAAVNTTITPGGPTSICQGSSVLLTAPAGTNYTYVWKLNSTVISGATANTYVANASGSYRVIISSGVNCTDSSSITVTVNPLPTGSLAITGGSSTYCAGTTNQLCFTPVLAGQTYQWQYSPVLGGGTFINIAGATASCYTPTATGQYCIAVTSAQGCTAPTFCQNITINPIPVSTITANGSTTFCTGGSVQLCASVIVSGNTYQWSLNGALIAGATGSCITATTSGTYCLAVTNTTTGCTSSSCQIVTAGAPPTANVTPVGPLVICQGSGVVLHTNNAPGLTYQWYNGSNAITGANDSTYASTAAGNYTVTVTLSVGCSSTSSPVIITVNPTPAATIGTLSPDICVGSTAPFTAGPAGNTYQFLLNGTPIAGATAQLYNFNPTAAGSYSISVIVNSSQSCADTSTVLSVTAHPKPAPVIAYTGGILSTTQPFTAYHWILNGTSIAAANATMATYAPQVNGTYNVTVWDIYGCNDTAQVPIVVIGVGIDDVAGIAGVKIYPNPASAVININATFVVNVVLRDMQGRIVLREKAAKAINIATLADGVYQLTATDASGRSLGSMRVLKMAK